MLIASFGLSVIATWIGKALAFVVMIAMIAFVHEFGHYAVAKLCGVKVYEFSLGIGHKIWGRKWGETEYTLRWIPIGAFVRPAGMNPDEDEAEGESDLKGRSFSEKWFIAKQAILAAGAGGNMVFAAALFSGLLYFSGIQTSNIEIREATPDKPAAQAGLTGGDIIVALDGVPITDHQQGINTIYAHPDVPLKVDILRFEKHDPVTVGGTDAGLKGELALSGSGVRFEVLSVEPGKSAEKAGLKPGWLITEVAGKGVGEFSTADDVVKAMAAAPVALTVMQARPLSFTVTPAKQADGKGRIGIASLAHTFGPRIPVELSEAIRRGVRRTADGVLMVYQQALGLLVTSFGKMEVPKEVGGPLKIASEIARGVDIGMIYLLQLTAFLSLAIGVFNLLPIPALDGGRMFVLAVKWVLELAHRVVRPKAESHEVIGSRGEEILHFMGFVFLIFLLIVVSWKDVREMTGSDVVAPPKAGDTPKPSDTPKPAK